jgi:hypothetical protein
MDLATWANIAEVAGLLTLLGGGGVALVQMHNANRQRADQAAIEMVRSLQGPKVIDEMYVLLDHADLTPAQVRADPRLERAALHAVFVFETLGVMVYERTLRLHVLDRMMGGFIRAIWQKVKPWVEDERQRTGVINHGEWTQWLAEQLLAHPEPSKQTGAYVAYRSWQP